MKRLLLLTAILCLGGCLNVTGTYDVNKKVQVFVGEECINLNEDKTNSIILAMTCEGQKATEQLTILSTAGLASGAIRKKRNLRTYRQAVTEWLESNGRSCVIEDTTEIFDMVLIGSEVYVDCEN
jgi:hypothetical protein|tara:strand:+ start:831 stop:1205 length:375 start_codon:yes stop_codon:yes gene_type:complete